MNPVFIRIVESGNPPTRADIAELLASVAPPGEKLTEKEAQVRELYDEAGHSPRSPQGFHVADDLTSWEEF